MSAWGDIPAGYTSVPCPRECGDEIYGTPDNIDSGVRKHLDNYCPVEPDTEPDFVNGPEHIRASRLTEETE